MKKLVIENNVKVNAFVEKWMDAEGNEQREGRSFLEDLLQDVLGMTNLTNRVEFEKKVKIDKRNKRIDAYIPETRTLIELKSRGVDLDKPQDGHGGMTPYQQAREYNTALPYSLKSKWIVVSNFDEIRIYNMNVSEPEKSVVTVNFNEFVKNAHLLKFMVNDKITHVKKEAELSEEACKLVGNLYNEIHKLYRFPDSDKTLFELNILITRIVLCAYAEDAGVFNKDSFANLIKKYSNVLGVLSGVIKELFEVLDTPYESRYCNPDLEDFPYIGGAMFRRKINVPLFNQKVYDLLIKITEFDWTGINPAVFGSIFESTLDPELRKNNGMYYTSVDNIHKCIDPLFLNDLSNELDEILHERIEDTRIRKLKVYQNKLASLTFFDPTCGSGNFLLETYMCLRRLENKVLKELGSNEIKVSVSQFYGVELSDFAGKAAKSAMFIVQVQMLKETEDMLNTVIEIDTGATMNIHPGNNSLTCDWNRTVIKKEELNYIIGNPPFIGARNKNKQQMEDVNRIFKDWKNSGNLDYVACWYKKCADYMRGTNIKAGLVSTSSICQGEQVSILWKPLFDMGININFAHRPFKWTNGSRNDAQVYCVIIGFDYNNSNNKTIYTEEGEISANNINGYLMDFDNIFIENRNKPLYNVNKGISGNKPIDGGNYLFTKDEMDNFILKEPESKKYFKPWYGAEEFVKNNPRYCLWLGDCTVDEINNMPLCKERVNNVKNYRLNSKSDGTKKIADKPTRFHVEFMPKAKYLIVPRLSTSTRKYIPMGFMNEDTLPSDATTIIPNINKYEFGILESIVHMKWVSTVCGSLGGAYRYSCSGVYNNYPWPEDITKECKIEIEKTANDILKARELYPNKTIMELYDPSTMPKDLKDAHEANDRAVLKAYGLKGDATEEEILKHLMKMYQDKVESLK